MTAPHRPKLSSRTVLAGSVLTGAALACALIACDDTTTQVQDPGGVDSSSAGSDQMGGNQAGGSAGATTDGGAGGNVETGGSGGATADGGSTSNAGTPTTGGDAGGTSEPRSGPVGQFDCGAAGTTAIPDLSLTEIAAELVGPVYLASPPGDDPRLFIVEKGGTVRILQDGQLLGAPFLDVSDRVDEPFNEMGLLGLALHPDFANNGRVYIYYSTEAVDDGSFLPAHVSVVAEYTVSSDNPNQVDPSSAREVLRIAEPEGNHNGGNLQFGPDGYLYIPTGDGGGGGDFHGEIGNGQSLDTLLAKMLRIDVDARDGELGYAIPAGNMPAPARPEIWSYGLRNPWRFSFDACTDDMYIGDVGEEEVEEIDFEPAGSGSGRNYGWRLMEAENCFEPDSGCDAVAQNLELPITSYGRDIGQSITGGYVYRGSAIPELRGAYLYADFLSSTFFALRMENGALVGEPQDISTNLNTVDTSAVASFGQDNRGNLYVVSFGGSVYRIDPG